MVTAVPPRTSPLSSKESGNAPAAPPKIVYAEGCRLYRARHQPTTQPGRPLPGSLRGKDEELIAQAVATAGSADTILLVLGGNEVLARESFGDSGGDLPVSFGDSDSIELPGRQLELVRRIAALGKPTVAVLINGKAYSLDTLSAQVPAIVEAWYPGQETGNAVAGILFGDVNPSGHLPVTIARNVGQLPVYYYRQPAARRGYILDTDKPLYPFGFGLSYTTFAIGTPVLDRAHDCQPPAQPPSPSRSPTPAHAMAMTSFSSTSILKSAALPNPSCCSRTFSEFTYPPAKPCRCNSLSTPQSSPSLIAR